MNFPFKKIGILFLSCLFGSVSSYAHESEPQLPFHLPKAEGALTRHAHLGWDSRYFSEGRDQLDGDSLAFSSLELGWEKFVGGLWYGYSPDQNYDELQINFSYVQSFGNLEWSLGYTHLFFPFDSTSDNEIGTGLSYSGLPMNLVLSADVYYSFDANGYFTELAASRDFMLSDRLVLSVSTPMGVNQEYVSDGHNGTNYIALRVGLKYELITGLSLQTHLMHSLEKGRNRNLAGDENLKNFLHGGVGLEWSF